MRRILLVDDEPHIISLLERALRSEGLEPVAAEDGETALEILADEQIDLVVLDVGLPGIDGFDVLRQIRENGSAIPVVMLTARSGTSDTVEALDAGASDYVPKPFVVAELLARIRSRLRESTAPATSVAHDGVSLDMLTRRASIDGREIDLSAREFALAEQFLRHPGEILSRETLLRQVWGLDFDPGSNVVDVYVRYLRGKVGARRIATVRGEGYRWEA
ncbi:response regulator transcription factor [Microbacterium imperiale]|uniref:DNA-binding response regulator n=1 Tax=Microbacterium imperiale TaxID=33884 RepID=A0A9W6HFJ7_9MICO|nr:response regulator transcription factor [Microbacterium imperiale]MBP2419265.1 DNA-binding response OmpR family regulator [Microbacterium imperiale]MDS0198863.1 response regulator transcription factor [Microbacterium imperiale]BFE39608.1 response regulator transcription factor [Microbacterium imperiale]GLJ79417.1 DNA-binding response regulator [Microbacterium imperiale]